jgi:hypothetical protein
MIQIELVCFNFLTFCWGYIDSVPLDSYVSASLAVGSAICFQGREGYKHDHAYDATPLSYHLYLHIFTISLK